MRIDDALPKKQQSPISTHSSSGTDTSFVRQHQPLAPHQADPGSKPEITHNKKKARHMKQCSNELERTSLFWL